jgi:ubiquinone/menaquinone biosynthesis C-methylase UbiE
VSDTPADEIREAVHGMWASVAEQWGAHADEVDARAEGLTARMLERAAPRPGDRVLELACGPGGVGLAAAALVGPDGEVVLSDVAGSMVAVAADRAAAIGADNTTTAILDLEAIDQPDATFDVALCRDGLMFTVEPPRAVAEIFRILRPGGRVALAVWGPPAANPWLGAVLDAVSTEVGMPVPPPGIPGPFALADARAVTGLVRAAGFVEVTIDEVAVPLRAPSFEDYWERTTAIAGPVAALLTGLEPDARRRITDQVRARLAPYGTAAGLDVPGVNLLASARRP